MACPCGRISAYKHGEDQPHSLHAYQSGRLRGWTPPHRDARAGVDIAFVAMVLDQQDPVLHRLTEAVARACGNGNHCPWIDVRHLSFERGLFPAIIGCRRYFLARHSWMISWARITISSWASSLSSLSRIVRQ